MPFSPKATARFRVVVVLATPPFWFASAMTCGTPAPFLPAMPRTFGRGSMRVSAMTGHCSGVGWGFLHGSPRNCARICRRGRVRRAGASPFPLGLVLAVPVVEVLEPGDEADPAKKILFERG